MYQRDSGTLLWEVKWPIRVGIHKVQDLATNRGRQGGQSRIEKTEDRLNHLSTARSVFLVPLCPLCRPLLVAKSCTLCIPTRIGHLISHRSVPLSLWYTEPLAVSSAQPVYTFAPLGLVRDILDDRPSGWDRNLYWSACTHDAFAALVARSVVLAYGEAPLLHDHLTP